MTQPDNEAGNLRRSARARRRGLSQAERDSYSLDIAQHVFDATWFWRAQRIAAYISLPEEVSTWPIIERAWRMKKRIFVPVIGANSGMRFRELSPSTSLGTNSLGIPEPTSGAWLDARRFDLVLTPLVAFDANGNRIGMGGGYYDRTFSFLKPRKAFFRPRLIGLAFACQQVKNFEPSPWDIPLFQVLTEDGVRATRR